MSTTRHAWWSRARWFFLLYFVIAVSAIFAPPFDAVIAGWRVAMLVSAGAACLGTLGGLRIITGRKSLHDAFMHAEFVGFTGIVVVETVHALYTALLAFTTGEFHFLARGAAHAAVAIACALAFRARPVRERRVS